MWPALLRRVAAGVCRLPASNEILVNLCFDNERILCIFK